MLAMVSKSKVVMSLAGIVLLGPQNTEAAYATRYWDCCKAHCSWSANVFDGMQPLGTCSKANAKQSDANIVSSCQSATSNAAFTCHDNVPWAVNDTLAYGFAAVPAKGDICGGCYELTFTGEGKYGPGFGATALKANGKKMIVQATNIGHDVSDEQFDIMIPGGGVGLFDACSYQWGATQEQMGAQYGGFFSACQATHGYNAAEKVYKTCMLEKCESVFGNSALAQLNAGCKFFVDWYEMADNPMLTYRQVACPAELVQISGFSRNVLPSPPTSAPPAAECAATSCGCGWATESTCATNDGSECNIACCCKFRIPAPTPAPASKTTTSTTSTASTNPLTATTVISSTLSIASTKAPTASASTTSIASTNLMTAATTTTTIMLSNSLIASTTASASTTSIASTNRMTAATTTTTIMPSTSSMASTKAPASSASTTSIMTTSTASVASTRPITTSGECVGNDSRCKGSDQTKCNSFREQGSDCQWDEHDVVQVSGTCLGNDSRCKSSSHATCNRLTAQGSDCRWKSSLLTSGVSGKCLGNDSRCADRSEQQCVRLFRERAHCKWRSAFSVSGSMPTAVSDVDSFVNNPNAHIAVKQGIANVTGVPSKYVDIDVSVEVVRRRLGTRATSANFKSGVIVITYAISVGGDAPASVTTTGDDIEYRLKQATPVSMHNAISSTYQKTFGKALPSFGIQEIYQPTVAVASSSLSSTSAPLTLTTNVEATTSPLSLSGSPSSPPSPTISATTSCTFTIGYLVFVVPVYLTALCWK